MIGTLHPAPIQGAMVVPWEPLGQISPGALTTHYDKYPAPWTTQHRGNGHVDVIDGEGRVFAHVYCWGCAVHKLLEQHELDIRADERRRAAEDVEHVARRHFVPCKIERDLVRAARGDNGGGS